MEKSNGFLMLDHDLIRGPIWRALSSNATRLLIDMADRYNGRNNGAIPYSIAEAARCLHCNKRTAMRVFAELREARLIECTRKGSFAASDRKGAASTWRITFLR